MQVLQSYYFAAHWSSWTPPARPYPFMPHSPPDWTFVVKPFTPVTWQDVPLALRHRTPEGITQDLRLVVFWRCDSHNPVQDDAGSPAYYWGHVASHTTGLARWVKVVPPSAKWQ